MENKREQTIFLIGKLGYNLNEENIKIASKLLEENVFTDVVNCIDDLDLYNNINNTSAYISIAGNYPKIKIKSADEDEILEILSKNNICI